MLKLKTPHGKIVRFNGTIFIKNFRPGEKIYLSQAQELILESSKRGRGKEEIIIKTRRKGVFHYLRITQSELGKDFYKIISINPIPL